MTVAPRARGRRPQTFTEPDFRKALRQSKSDISLRGPLVVRWRPNWCMASPSRAASSAKPKRTQADLEGYR